MSMYEITERSAAPYRSIAYIICEWSDGKSVRATGVVVGPNDVLTAHHVLLDAQRGYPNRIFIYPGADSSPFNAPLGTWSDVTSIDARSARWDVDGDSLLWGYESQYDLALIGLASRIGDVTGWLTASTWTGTAMTTLAGYPARGTGLMVNAVHTDGQSGVSTFVAQGALGPGASGGPMLRTTGATSTTEFLGILSAGDFDLTESTYAAFFDAGNYLWLVGAIASNDQGGTQAMGYGLRQPITGITGTSGGDTLSGTDGHDTFQGSGGTDSINALGGIDTMMYAGPRSSYDMRRAEDGSIVVTDQIGQGDDIDILRNFERITFADVTVNLTIGSLAGSLPAQDLKLLMELYVAFFNRVPEADGLAYWIGQARAGMTTAQMADAFYYAAQLYPQQTGYSAGMSHSEFVNHVYRNTLGRSEGADAGGLAYWTEALASGQESRGSLVKTILWAAHNFKGDATWGWVADLLDHKADAAREFAVIQALNYNTPEASIAVTRAVAAAVTPAGEEAAVALIGVGDQFSG